MQRKPVFRVAMKRCIWNKRISSTRTQTQIRVQTQASPHVPLRFPNTVPAQPHSTRLSIRVPCYLCASVHQCKANYFSSFSDFKYSSSWSRSAFHRPSLLFELIPFCSISPLIGTCNAFKVWNPIPVNFIDSFQGLLISYANSCLFQKEKTKQPFGENAFKICKEPPRFFSQL